MRHSYTTDMRLTFDDKYWWLTRSDLFLSFSFCQLYFMSFLILNLSCFSIDVVYPCLKTSIILIYSLPLHGNNLSIGIKWPLKWPLLIANFKYFLQIFVFKKLSLDFLLFSSLQLTMTMSISLILDPTGFQFYSLYCLFTWGKELQISMWPPSRFSGEPLALALF